MRNTTAIETAIPRQRQPQSRHGRKSTRRTQEWRVVKRQTSHSKSDMSKFRGQIRVITAPIEEEAVMTQDPLGFVLIVRDGLQITDTVARRLSWTLDWTC